MAFLVFFFGWGGELDSKLVKELSRLDASQLVSLLDRRLELDAVPSGSNDKPSDSVHPRPWLRFVRIAGMPQCHCIKKNHKGQGVSERAYRGK